MRTWRKCYMSKVFEGILLLKYVLEIKEIKVSRESYAHLQSYPKGLFIQPITLTETNDLMVCGIKITKDEEI